MAKFDINEHQHIRYNPLRGDWVLVSPHRMDRPWAGQVEQPSIEKIPPFDPKNPLCPGVTRPNGKVTPNYTSTYVFENDFPAILDKVPSPPKPTDDLFIAKPANGVCKVMCFHPRSDVHFYNMTIEEIGSIINEWQNQMKELGATYKWVQIFENKGQIMGCSNPHPHCQIWSSDFMPNEPKLKDENQRNYYCKHGTQLLADYVKMELEKKERIIYENKEWLVVVPYWAVWPFETMILPKRQVQRFLDLDSEQKISLAHTLKAMVIMYDNLFKCSFPYSMGWHGAPTGPCLKENNDHWTFHGVYYPPLLRSCTVKKFMVGYELLAQAQRDLTPEKAALRLRELPKVHYTETLASSEKNSPGGAKNTPKCAAAPP